jgi:dihydrofolate synthase/folylpolyglutamate synthase
LLHNVNSDAKVEKQTLAEWLDYQQRVHPRSIELGLDRVAEVWRRLGRPAPAPVVITIGGTNGKGSTVAFFEAMLAADGKRTGCYTSPHLLRYNERVRVAGADADDAALVDAFERIEAARAEIPLTYFEFGTLAALWIFAQSEIDVALLEVGLGGRLDAVNIVDADAALVTTVDLDHQDWLGNDRDSIGREKAGIFRAGRPAIVGTDTPPHGLLGEAERIGALVSVAGRDYRVVRGESAWQWQSAGTLVDLPWPTLAAPCQVDNAAAAIAALHALRDRLGWNPSALVHGVLAARVAARLQRMRAPAAADVIVDVAHNPQAARALAQWLKSNPSAGCTFAVFGALDDKDIAGIVAPLLEHVDCWMLAALDGLSPRGLAGAQLQARVHAAAPSAAATTYGDPRAALAAARSRARPDDRILAFGSFYVAGEVLAAMDARG